MVRVCQLSMFSVLEQSLRAELSFFFPQDNVNEATDERERERQPGQDEGVSVSLTVVFPSWTHHRVDDGPAHHKQTFRREQERENYKNVDGVLQHGQVKWDLIGKYSLARTWKTAVKKKRPPFMRVKSWQRKMMKEIKQKMVARTMSACTA